VLEQKEIEVNGKTYVISKFPAVAGREIVTQYPLSATPKLGDYQTNESIMLKIMCYVGVKVRDSSTILWLKTRELVDNHIPNWEDLMKVEYAAMEYNCSFLADGKISEYLTLAQEKLPSWISKILTPLLDALSPKEKQPSKNSKKAIL
jgi:hypothetical protein